MNPVELGEITGQQIPHRIVRANRTYVRKRLCMWVGNDCLEKGNRENEWYVL